MNVAYDQETRERFAVEGGHGLEVSHGRYIDGFIAATIASSRIENDVHLLGLRVAWSLYWKWEPWMEGVAR